MSRRNRRKKQGNRRAAAKCAQPMESVEREPHGSPESSSPDRRFIVGLIVVFITALAARLMHVRAIDSAPVAQLLLGDAESYYSWALRLVSGDWAGGDVFYQAPLYPYFIGALFSIFEPDVSVIRLAQAVLGSLACVFLALAGRSWFTPTPVDERSWFAPVDERSWFAPVDERSGFAPSVGIVAGLALAFYGPAIFFTGLVQKTTLALVLFTALLWALGESAKRARRPALWVTVGLCLGLTALARENALILVAPILLWIGLDRAATTSRASRALAFLVGLAAILGPVALRNYSVGGDVAVTTSQLGTNLYIGNNPDADGTYRPLRAGRDDPQFEAFDARAIAEEKSGRSLSANEVSSFYVREVLDYVTTQPLDWLRLTGRKILLAANAHELADTEDLLSHAEHSSILSAAHSVWHFGILVPLAALGMVLTASRWRRLWLLIAVIGFYAAGLVAFFIFARYRFFAVPALMLFASAGVLELVSLLRRPQLRPLMAAAAAAVMAFVASNRPLLEPDVMRSVTQFNYGLGFERRGERELARESYLNAIALQSNLAEAHYRVGVLDAEDGRTDTAIAHFESAVSISPDFHAVRTSLGFLLMERGDVDAAESHFREALRIVPGDSQALNNLANLAFQRRDLDEARSLYERSAKLEPGNAQTHNNLGIIAAIQNELPRAVQHFRDALAADPGYEDARLNLARAQTGT